MSCHEMRAQRSLHRTRTLFAHTRRRLFLAVPACCMPFYLHQPSMCHLPDLTARGHIHIFTSLTGRTLAFAPS